MSGGNRRRILRIALLQDFAGRPESLMGYLDEIAAKGYHGVDTWVNCDDYESFRPLCERAAALGLSVGLCTSYMIGQFDHLARHPEQRFVQAAPGVDVYGLGSDAWGCPFNPDFKARYLDMLRRVAAFPGVERMWLNDEASLATGCYCRVCTEEYEREFNREMPRIVRPTGEEWRDVQWRRFLKWRIDRWNAVHAELADAVHAVNPKVLVGFQASPSMDLWWNPWYTAVDLHGMSRGLDALSVDPYYTSHKPVGFVPLEVYMSEWSRFLKGILPKGKRAQIIVQGFSHPNFVRPLNEADGIWTALVPPACGADLVMPYSYTLQRVSPAQKPHEACFRFDRYFERSEPLKYAAVVHGVQTEVYARPLPHETMGSYDGTRLFPISESLRDHGVPYGYLADGRLDGPGALAEYEAVVLPEIDCLSRAQAEAVTEYFRGGGTLIVLGDLGSHDEMGSRIERSLLEELCGIRIVRESGEERSVRFREDLPISTAIPKVDERAAMFWGGSFRPVCRLRHCLDAEVPGDAEVLAHFADDEGHPSDRPAVISLRRGGHLLWFAGFPSSPVSIR